MLVKLYCSFLKSNFFTTKTNLFRLFSAGLIEKKQKNKIKQGDDIPFVC